MMDAYLLSYYFADAQLQSHRITLVTDVALDETVLRRRQFHYQLAEGSTAQEMVDDMEKGKFNIHGDGVVFLIGNTENKNSPVVLTAIPYHALIRKCLQKYPDIHVYLAGAMPRLQDEEETLQCVKHENQCMAKSAKDLKKRWKLLVTFIGVYNIFLEHFNFYNEKLHGRSSRTRVTGPVPQYFVSIKDGTLNKKGADKLYNYILQCTGKPFTGPAWEKIPVVYEDPRSTDSK